MSAIGDILEGVRKTVLLQDNVTRLEKRIETLIEDVARTRDFASGIDRRVVRLETMVEMAAGTKGAEGPPRIRG